VGEKVKELMDIKNERSLLDANQYGFSIRLARTQKQVMRAVKMRSDAYGRHLPEFAETLKTPEKYDASSDTVVFLAEPRDKGDPFGTMRLQVCTKSPLLIEESIDLPDFIGRRPRVSVTRLAVKPGHQSRIVKMLLFKAMLQYCLALQIDWIVIAARPPVDRTFVALGFTDIFDEGKLYPIKSANEKLHRVLVMSPRNRERTSFLENHPLHGFFFHDYHSDIEIFESISSASTSPRRSGNFDAIPSLTEIHFPLV
jgi:hypothetical protein